MRYIAMHPHSHSHTHTDRQTFKLQSKNVNTKNFCKQCDSTAKILRFVIFFRTNCHPLRQFHLVCVCVCVFVLSTHREKRTYMMQ